MVGDLIDFEKEVTGSPNSINASPGSMPSKVDHVRGTHRDSFSDLASMMKTKKPYTQIVPSVPRSLPLTVSLNGPQPANRIASQGSIPSPLERRLHPTDFIFEPVSEHNVEILAQYHNEKEQENTFRNSEASMWEFREHATSRPYNEHSLIPGFDLPVRNGPNDPPSPPHSTLISSSAEKLRHGGHDIGLQLGKLRYQNESNKAQKSAMGRALAEKETTIKTQQLEIEDLKSKVSTLSARVQELEGVSGECDYLRSAISLYKKENENATVDLAALKDQHRHALSELAASKDCELKDAKEIIQKLRTTVNETNSQKLEVSKSQVNSEYGRIRAREHAEVLAKREKIITDLRHRLMEADLKVVDLEDENEALKEKSKQIDIDALRDMLREKTSECDRQRNHARLVEARFKQCQERLLHITKNGASLQGAVFLVKPQAESKLPRTVHICTECYAKNLECDNKTICRSCTEGSTPCLRWRCALKHKLGECPLTPCKFPHDSQGWLMLPRDRPQW